MRISPCVCAGEDMALLVSAFEQYGTFLIFVFFLGICPLALP